MSERTKHTPSPWRIIDRERHEDGSVSPRMVVGGARSLHICDLEPSSVAQAISDGRMTDHDDMFEAAGDVRSKAANANLIAAAPKLVEACISAYRALARPDVDALAIDPGYRAELLSAISDALGTEFAVALSKECGAGR